MTSRRDWQLQQLGITQWALRRPGALQGEIAISLPRARSSDRGCRGITCAERAANARYLTRVDRESRSGFTADA
ncbi:DNA polymerase III subunit psi [Salmonella enterica subsp. enterica]|nr:DNA polymerase III subunit psi [Salmonella enterica subsp. enterica]